MASIRNLSIGIACVAVLAVAGRALPTRVADAAEPRHADPIRPAAAAIEHAIDSQRIDIEFRDGSLAIDVKDAPLADVLASIGRSTGLRFEGDADGRVSFRSGPQPLRSAVADLLGRTPYGYVYLEARPGDTARVLLVRRGVPRAIDAPANRAVPVPAPDESELRQQQATDAQFEACKAGACDSS